MSKSPAPMPPSQPEHAELSALVRSHARRVRRVLARRGVAAADLPDVEQEVFIVAQRKLSEFEGRSSVTTWLLGIASNLASQHRRKAHHRRERLGLNAEPMSDALDPLARLQAIESVARVRRMLDVLSPEQRDVIVLHELTELSMHEVARELDVPLKTAFSRLYAGHRALRRALSRAEQRAIRRSPARVALLGVLPGRWLSRAQAWAGQLSVAAIAALCVVLGATATPAALELTSPSPELVRQDPRGYREVLPVVLAPAVPLAEPRAPAHRRSAVQSRPAVRPARRAAPPPSPPAELVVFHLGGGFDALPYLHPFAERAFTSVDPRTVKPRVVMPREHAACGRAHGPCAL